VFTMTPLRLSGLAELGSRPTRSTVFTMTPLRLSGLAELGSREMMLLILFPLGMKGAAAEKLTRAAMRIETRMLNTLGDKEIDMDSSGNRRDVVVVERGVERNKSEKITLIIYI
jgi:hypothetical protein